MLWFWNAELRAADRLSAMRPFGEKHSALLVHCHRNFHKEVRTASVAERRLHFVDDVEARVAFQHELLGFLDEHSVHR